MSDTKDPNERRRYVVTDVGGVRPDVAGKRRRVGDVLELTESEAMHEISRGVIKLEDGGEDGGPMPAIPAEGTAAIETGGEGTTAESATDATAERRRGR